MMLLIKTKKLKETLIIPEVILRLLLIPFFIANKIQKIGTINT